jgi:hypothetical protein
VQQRKTLVQRPALKYVKAIKNLWEKYAMTAQLQVFLMELGYDNA